MDYKKIYQDLRDFIYEEYGKLKDVDLSSSNPSDYVKFGKIDILLSIMLKMAQSEQNKL